MDNQQMNPGMASAPVKKGGAMKWIVIIIVLALIVWGAMTLLGGESAPATDDTTATDTSGQPTVEGGAGVDVEVVPVTE